MTRYVFTGSDGIDNATANPPRADDEFVGNFFGERDELQLVQGLLKVNMGTGNDNVRGYSSGGVIYLGEGDDNAAVGIDAALKELLVYGQGGDDVLNSSGFGERGDIRLFGGDGSDKFELDVKAERYDGGRGWDFIGAVSNASGSLVSSDTIVSVEGQDGSAAADLITSWGTDAISVGDVFAQVGITSVVNALQGGQGADTLQGGARGDILIGNAYRFLQESLGGFRGQGGVPITREALTADDAAVDDLRGSGGNDYLDGGDGADLLNGGTGNDTASYASFQANTNSGVSVNLATRANSDGDTLTSIENLVGSEYRGYSGSGDDTLSGNSLVNILVGRSGSDVLNGQGGRDTLYGDADADTLIDLDGGDTLHGGSGADIYRLGKAATIVELAGGGYDVVETAASIVLSDNVEEARLTGSAAISATGNAEANLLVGNDSANRLDGKAGQDTLVGGKGNDTYVVTDTLDTLTELAGEGIDTVESSIAYTLKANFENLTLTGSATIEGRGNELANVLTGNLGRNALRGLDGDDTYVIDQLGDKAYEQAGQGTNDLVRASVSYSLAGQDIENLTLTGASAIDATGNGLANGLIGNGAANRLDGGLGQDVLTGGSGADSFVFRTALGSSNVDRITDYRATDDTIELAKSVFKALDTGTLSDSAFKTITSPATTIDADDRILYVKATGALSYDIDGSGSAKAVQFAVIDNHTTLTFQDFLVA